LWNAFNYFCVGPTNVLKRPWPYAVRVQWLCVRRTVTSSPNLSPGIINPLYVSWCQAHTFCLVYRFFLFTIYFRAVA